MKNKNNPIISDSTLELLVIFAIDEEDGFDLNSNEKKRLSGVRASMLDNWMKRVSKEDRAKGFKYLAQKLKYVDSEYIDKVAISWLMSQVIKEPEIFSDSMDSMVDLNSKLYTESHDPDMVFNFLKIINIWIKDKTTPFNSNSKTYDVLEDIFYTLEYNLGQMILSKIDKAKLDKELFEPLYNLSQKLNDHNSKSKNKLPEIETIFSESNDSTLWNELWFKFLQNLSKKKTVTDSIKEQANVNLQKIQIEKFFDFRKQSKKSESVIKKEMEKILGSIDKDLALKVFEDVGRMDVFFMQAGADILDHFLNTIKTLGFDKEVFEKTVGKLCVSAMEIGASNKANDLKKRGYKIKEIMGYLGNVATDKQKKIAIESLFNNTLSSLHSGSRYTDTINFINDLIKDKNWSEAFKGVKVKKFSCGYGEVWYESPPSNTTLNKAAKMTEGMSETINGYFYLLTHALDGDTTPYNGRKMAVPGRIVEKYCPDSSFETPAFIAKATKTMNRLEAEWKKMQIQTAVSGVSNKKATTNAKKIKM